MFEVEKSHNFETNNSLIRQNSIYENENQVYPKNSYTDDWMRQPNIDPRDIKIVLSIDKVVEQVVGNTNLDVQKHVIRKWLVNMYGIITSDSFNKYNKDQLRQSEVKVYACKNYLFNITRLMESLKLQIQDKPQYFCNQIFQFINDESKEIINELILKYPQSSGRQKLKYLQNQIKKTDNIESDRFDLFQAHKIKFQYIEKDYSYTKQIMKAINLIVSIGNNPLHNANKDYSSQSNFDGFATFLEYMFLYSGARQCQKEFEQSSKVYQSIQDQDQEGYQKPVLFQLLFSPKNEEMKNNMEQIKNKNSKLCSFEVHQKIPSDTTIFTDHEINQEIFRILDVSVLRVMTKWAQQLRSKLKNAKKEFIERAEPFQTSNGVQISLTPKQRNNLYQQAKKQEKRISKIYSQIQLYYKEMSGNLSMKSFNCLYTNDNDTNVAIYSVRSQICIGQCLLSYLNQLIHSLLKIVKQASKAQKEQFQKELIYSINLITFKVGDLLRAKLKSTQKHIIEVFKFFEKISQKRPHFLEIVRVKDRLNQKDKDILLNVFFMKRVLCQIQFSVSVQMDQKQKKYNSFNHLIYELKRSQFGPLAESACIVAQYDPVVSTYIKKQELFPKYIFQRKKNQLQSLNLDIENDLERLQKKLPFFCFSCCKFDKNLNPYFYKQFRSTTNKKICNRCLQSKQDFTKLIAKQFKIQNDYKPVQNEHELKTIKSGNSGFLISKNTQYKQLVKFLVVQLNENKQSIYLVEKNQQKKCKILHQIDKNKTSNILSSSFIFLKNQEKQYSQVIKMIKNMKIQQQIKIVSTKGKQSLLLSNRQIQNQLQFLLNQNMPKVVAFYASSNKIEKVNFFKNLRNLKKINIGYNKIESLSELLQQTDLQKLQQLKCQHNQISNADFIGKIKTLKTINLSYNKILAIPNISELIQLKVLNLQQQNKKNIKSIIFSQFNRLSFNKQKYFQEGTSKEKQIIGKWYFKNKQKAQDIKKISINKELNLQYLGYKQYDVIQIKKKILSNQHYKAIKQIQKLQRKKIFKLIEDLLKFYRQIKLKQQKQRKQNQKNAIANQEVRRSILRISGQIEVESIHENSDQEMQQQRQEQIQLPSRQSIQKKLENIYDILKSLKIDFQKREQSEMLVQLKQDLKQSSKKINQLLQKIQNKSKYYQELKLKFEQIFKRILKLRLKFVTIKQLNLAHNPLVIKQQKDFEQINELFKVNNLVLSYNKKIIDYLFTVENYSIQKKKMYSALMEQKTKQKRKQKRKQQKQEKGKLYIYLHKDQNNNIPNFKTWQKKQIIQLRQEQQFDQ